MWPRGWIASTRSRGAALPRNGTFRLDDATLGNPEAEMLCRGAKHAWHMGIFACNMVVLHKNDL